MLLAVAALVTTGCGSLSLVPPDRTPRPTPTPAPTFDAARTGFDGLVVDADGEPIEGVHIVLMSGGRRGTAATTAEGTFSDRGTVGVIEVTAELDGYETEELTITVVPNEIAEVEVVLIVAGD
jgi:hypothetical protein